MAGELDFFGGKRRNSMQDMMREFDDLFDRFRMSTGSLIRGGQGQPMLFQPQVDIEEREKDFRICADLPGVKKEDIHVELQDRILTISGDRSEQKREESEGRIQIERQHGRFRRQFTLPQNVDEQGVQAHFEDGVLEVLVPKSEGSNKRRINVQSGRQVASSSPTHSQKH